MAPVVAFSPKHSCSNYPICTATAFRNTDGAKRSWSPFCRTCSTSIHMCAFEGCRSRAAPMLVQRKPLLYCSQHYRDPSLHALRVWKLCANAKLGCKQLAQLRKGGKCFACNAHSYPCQNSLLGCLNHVRSSGDVPPRNRATCSAHTSLRCPFDSSVADRCSTALCGNKRKNSAEPRCSACSEGSTPCVNLCSRRAALDSDGYCSLCRCAPSGASPSSSRVSRSEDCNPRKRPFELMSQSDQALHTLPTPWLLTCSGHAPPHACGNFPICSRLQRNNRSQEDHSGARRSLGRDWFCSVCLNSLLSGTHCKHPSCGNPVAPTHAGKDPHSFCAFHLRDLAHESVRSWSRCANFHTGGCLHLSLRPKSGKCYACDSSFVPCANALKGCFKHVRLDPKSRILRECSGDNVCVADALPTATLLAMCPRACRKLQLGTGASIEPQALGITTEIFCKLVLCEVCLVYCRRNDCSLFCLRFRVNKV